MLDWFVIGGLLVFMAYCMHTEYGIDVVGIFASLFPREADVLARVFRDIFQ